MHLTPKVRYLALSTFLCHCLHTWKLIGSLGKRKTYGHIFPSRIIHSDMTFTNQKDIAELFNRFFVNSGPTLAKKIKTDRMDPTQQIKSTPVNSFYLAPVTQAQGLMSTACQTKLSKIKESQNNCLRCIFFANKRESPAPYFTVLGILNLQSILN